MTVRPSTRVRSLIGVAAVALVAAAAIAVTGGGTTHSGPFGWLRPAGVPPAWHLARTPAGAAFAYPPGWRPVRTDAGTASAALVDSRGRIVGYLNATPRQGAESLSNWSGFRPDHNRDEGDRRVHVLAAATGLRFRSGVGSCVIDGYSTSLTAYREIACLVSGHGTTTVFVAAAPSASWQAQAPLLERALSTASS